MIDADVGSPAAADQAVLPDRPAQLADREVAGWRQPVTIESYRPVPPDRYPAYLDRRVYQGSSGRVYPLPFFERIEPESRPVEWDAIHLENQWVRLMITPQLGGRIQFALDKSRRPAFDFFYRNRVIKPALVGLTGPWIAGGVELNWPQHHRPASYLPCSTEIEEEADGAVTVWCSDHDPFQRMKGMHGVRLRPDSSLIELRVRLYNRTELPQSFLWWANVAGRAHDQYQSFFPTDVTMVADHAKRAVTAFPAADRPYYGVDYPARAGLVGDGSVSGDGVGGDRLDWYRNIAVPTSYMCMRSDGDFFGGYDHLADAGFVHVADHRIAPGKKMWTWGNAAFGQAWGRQLADDGEAYVELMAGVYTDNQPDFSWIAPGETKTFSQFWYPISEIGPVQNATTEAAVRCSERSPTELEAKIAATARRPRARVELIDQNGVRLAEQSVDLAPGAAAICRLSTAEPIPARTRIEVSHGGRLLVDRQLPDPQPRESVELRPAVEPPPPEKVDSIERLWLIGVHLTQYRHATRSPLPYWNEALRRDPGHTPTLLELADDQLRRGEYESAIRLCRTAIDRLTEWNPNPSDGRAHYLLGVACERGGDLPAAYDAYGKAGWSRAWRGPAGYRMARLDAAAGRDRQALHHLDQVAAVEPDHVQAGVLRAVVLRRLGRPDDAERSLQDQLRWDPLHGWARDLAGRPLDADAQSCLDIALEYAGCGEHRAALRMLDTAAERDRTRDPGSPALGPLINYYRSSWLGRIGDHDQADLAAHRAATDDDHSCFPGRLDDHDLLQSIVAVRPADPTAAGLLGHWLYAHDRPLDAIRHWQDAARIDPRRSVIWRNLGLAAVNVHDDLDTARTCYRRATELAPEDSRLSYEQDRLLELAGESSDQRLHLLQTRLDHVRERDDLAIRYAELLIHTGAVAEAEELLRSRRFQPWEGGEGTVLRCWDRVQLALAEDAMLADPEQAVAAIEAALEPPESLGEARHPLANSAQLRLALGDALDRLGRSDDARAEWRKAADQISDFLGMATTPFSEATVFSIQALHRLGDAETAERLTAELSAYVDTVAGTEPTVDYFATSLPDLLLFAEDPHRARDRRVAELRALIAAQLPSTDQQPAEQGASG